MRRFFNHGVDDEILHIGQNNKKNSVTEFISLPRLLSVLGRTPLVNMLLDGVCCLVFRLVEN